MYIIYDEVDEFVANAPDNHLDLRWDGWDLILFKPDNAARRSPEGRWRRGRWGYDIRVSPDDRGRWDLPVNIGEPLG